MATTTAKNVKKESGISIIGLGLMGQALAATFLKAGQPTTVWNRTTAKAEDLVAQGATLAESVGDAYLDDDHDLSSLYDVAILNIMWSTLNTFYHGAALLETAGVKASTYVPMAKGLVKSLADWLPVEAQQIDDSTHLDPPSDSTLDTSLAAMEHLIHESESQGINADLPRFIKELPDRTVVDGHGGASYAAMIEQFRKPSV